MNKPISSVADLRNEKRLLKKKITNNSASLAGMAVTSLVKSKTRSTTNQNLHTTIENNLDLVADIGLKKYKNTKMGKIIIALSIAVLTPIIVKQLTKK